MELDFQAQDNLIKLNLKLKQWIK